MKRTAHVGLVGTFVGSLLIFQVQVAFASFNRCADIFSRIGTATPALVEYLEKYKIMTRAQAELVERMKREILIRQSQKQTENRAIFHKVEPGRFKMGEVGSQIDVNLTKPFDMMATPTTQVVWKKVADLAKSKFGGKYQINAEPSEFKGDTRPVEQVTYYDIQMWINGLNELSQVGDPALNDLIPGHKEGDVYRLPTEAEWEFVVRGRGQYNDRYHFGSQKSQLGDYAWFRGNAGSETHPVGQKKPLVIGGKEFYDMHGNVWEWTQDFYQSSLPGGTDPQGPNWDSGRVVRGGSWARDAYGVRSSVRGSFRPGVRSPFIGFRLVRTAK